MASGAYLKARYRSSLPAFRGEHDEKDEGRREAGPTQDDSVRYERTVVLFTHRDLLRLRFRTLRKSDRKHTILVVGADVGRIDRRGPRERTAERATEALETVEAIAGDLFILPLTLQREHVVLERDRDVFALHVRQLGLDHELVLGAFVNIHRRHPATRQAFAVEVGKHVVEPIDLHRRQLMKRIPSNESHCKNLLKSLNG